MSVLQEVPRYGANPYQFDDPAKLVAAIHELDEKARLLHEERGKAWHAMLDARTQHDFLVRCADAAESECRTMRHRLEELVRRDAIRLVEGGVPGGLGADTKEDA